VNLLRIEPGERIRKILPVQELTTEGYIVMVSKQGKIKKTSISEFSRPRSTGLIALTIDPDDELIDVNFTTGSNDILLSTRKGKAIRFNEDQVRPMGRPARGVKSITMRRDDSLIGMEVISDGSRTLLTITENGFGKRSPLSEYPVHNRGGQGVITIKHSEQTGDVVGIQMVDDPDHLLILTSGGRIIRIKMEEISAIGRNTRGRYLVRMSEGEKVVDVARAEPGDDEGGPTEEGETQEEPAGGEEA